MTFQERVTVYTEARVVAEKALKRYLKTREKAEELRAEWEALSSVATDALMNIKNDTESTS